MFLSLNLCFCGPNLLAMSPVLLSLPTKPQLSFSADSSARRCPYLHWSLTSLLCSASDLLSMIVSLTETKTENKGKLVHEFLTAHKINYEVLHCSDMRHARWTIITFCIHEGNFACVSVKLEQQHIWNVNVCVHIPATKSLLNWPRSGSPQL